MGWGVGDGTGEAVGRGVGVGMGVGKRTAVVEPDVIVIVGDGGTAVGGTGASITGSFQDWQPT